MWQCVLQGNGNHKTKQAENGGQNSTTNKFLSLLIKCLIYNSRTLYNIIMILAEQDDKEASI